MRFPVRVIHPKHGAMHVYDTANLEKAKKRGWELEEQEEKPEIEKKRGRPKKVTA